MRERPQPRGSRLAAHGQRGQGWKADSPAWKTHRAAQRRDAQGRCTCCAQSGWFGHTRGKRPLRCARDRHSTSAPVPDQHSRLNCLVTYVSSAPRRAGHRQTLPCNPPPWAAARGRGRRRPRTQLAVVPDRVCAIERQSRVRAQQSPVGRDLHARVCRGGPLVAPRLAPLVRHMRRPCWSAPLFQTVRSALLCSPHCAYSVVAAEAVDS